MKYKISKEAFQDIDEIWLYTCENWSFEQANRYFDLLMDEIEHLVKHPKSGTNYNFVRKGYFRSRVKSHFIFYTISREKEEVYIIRILHQRMDIESHLD